MVKKSDDETEARYTKFLERLSIISIIVTVVVVLIALRSLEIGCIVDRVSIPEDETNYTNQCYIAPEKVSPSDHITDAQIHIYNDSFTINVGREIIYAGYADTNSMDPLMDASANGVEIKSYEWLELNDGTIPTKTLARLRKVFPSWDGQIETLEAGHGFEGTECEIVVINEPGKDDPTKAFSKVTYMNPIGGSEMPQAARMFTRSAIMPTMRGYPIEVEKGR